MLEKIKSVVRKIPFLYRILRPENIHSHAYWIERYIPNRPMSVVQIGSNDGVSGDPIYHLVKKNTNWRVLFVEPVFPIFQELKKNYGDEARFKFENAAINADGANQYFYIVDKRAYKVFPELSKEYDQIGSFDKDHIVTLSEGKLKEFVKEIEVNCLSLDGLFEKNGLKSLDLLLIDAEGYDWKIVSQLNLRQYAPTIITLEHCNLDAISKQNAIDYLRDQYHVFSFRIDFFCIRKGVFTPKDLNKLKSCLVNH